MLVGHDTCEFFSDIQELSYMDVVPGGCPKETLFKKVTLPCGAQKTAIFVNFWPKIEV